MDYTQLTDTELQEIFHAANFIAQANTVPDAVLIFRGKVHGKA